jgi:hypothetical protein
MRWIGLAWLCVWIPAYWHFWGWYNFLFFCDVAVILTCIGLWRGTSLLLSSQAVGAIVINLMWTLDVMWRLLLGRRLIGGTEYMWDAQFPLWIRLLSLFHIIWPILVVWAVRRVGYDSRGFSLQCLIAAALMILSRAVEGILSTGKNLNFVLTDPIFHRSWGPAPVHLLFHLVVLVTVIYLPTHLLLRRLIPNPALVARRDCE